MKLSEIVPIDKHDKAACNALTRVIGDKDIAQITKGEVARFITNSGMQQRSALRYVFYIKSNLAYSGINFPLPELRGKLASKYVRRNKCLSPAELSLIMRKASPNVRKYITIGAMTGMRLGEIAKLSYSQVDFNTNEIVLDADNVKTGTGRRIPIDKSVRAILLETFGEGTGKTFAERTVKPSTVQNSWINIMHDLEFSYHFHDLRHTFGTRMAEAKVDIQTIADIMGHASLSTTRLYLASLPEHFAKARRALGNIMKGAARG